MPSLLPHDLCHRRSSSHWLPAGTFLSYGQRRVLGSVLLMVDFQWVFITVWMSMLFRSECFCFWDRGDWMDMDKVGLVWVVTDLPWLPSLHVSFSQSHAHWNTLIFMWADFLKMALTNPIPHVLLTVCWTYLHGVGGLCPPPLPWIFMRASGGIRQWNLMEVMVCDLQGWVVKGSDLCLSPSFGTLALSSQAPCWEEPSRYHVVGPPWRTCKQCQLPDVWVNALSVIPDLRLHGIDSHHPFCALSKFLMHQIHEHNKWLFYITKFGGHFLVAIVSTVLCKTFYKYNWNKYFRKIYFLGHRLNDFICFVFMVTIILEKRLDSFH